MKKLPGTWSAMYQVLPWRSDRKERKISESAVIAEAGTITVSVPAGTVARPMVGLAPRVETAYSRA